MDPPIEWEANAWRCRWVTLLLCWEFIGPSIWVSVFLWEPSGIYFPHTARSEREFECMRRELAEYFSRFQSLFSGLNYNIWNSLNAEAWDPSSYKQQKGDFKKISPVSFHRHPPATTSYFTMILLRRNGPLEVSQLDTTCWSPIYLCNCAA